MSTHDRQQREGGADAASSFTPAGVDLVLLCQLCSTAFVRVCSLSFCSHRLPPMPALAGPFEDAVAQVRQRRIRRHRRRRSARSPRRGNPLASPIISALQDGRLIGRSRQQESLSSPSADGKVIDAATGAAVRPAAGRRRRRAPQQPPAPRRRGRAGRADAAVARSRASGCRPRRRCSRSRDASALPVLDGALAKETDHGASSAPSPRRAPRSCWSSPMRPRPRSSRPSPRSGRAATRRRWRC